MRSVSLLIKPASSLCDLRCKYCFYANVAANREIKSYGIMTAETMERLIQAAFEASDPGGLVSFAFQGGEPTLAGLPFFEAFTEAVERLRKPDVQIAYAIQTNGMSLDENWAQFLHAHNFLVGISIDGDKDIHDLHRVDATGKGTWSRVVKALRLLQQHEVETNILCVVSNACSRSPQRVYTALKKLGVRYLQFIPCLDPLEEERGSRPYSLKPERYGKFLCGLFDAWYQDWTAGNYVSIRLFDDYVHLFMGMPPGTCATSGQCGSYFVVEGDGSLYPCDFYVLDEWRLGSVQDGRSLTQLANGELAAAFQARSHTKPAECKNCPWVRYCCGGCPRDWYILDSAQHNYFCPAFRTFFEYAALRLQEIAAAEIAARRHNQFNFL